MVGSPAVGFWIAHGAFWMLLLLLAARERRLIAALIFMVLWVGGYVAARGAQTGSYWFMSYVAVLDIALVFIIFKGDIRLTGAGR